MRYNSNQPNLMTFYTMKLKHHFQLIRFQHSLHAYSLIPKLFSTHINMVNTTYEKCGDNKCYINNINGSDFTFQPLLWNKVPHSNTTLRIGVSCSDTSLWI